MDRGPAVSCACYSKPVIRDRMVRYNDGTAASIWRPNRHIAQIKQYCERQRSSVQKEAMTEPVKTNNRTAVPSTGAEDIGRGSVAIMVARCRLRGRRQWSDSSAAGSPGKSASVVAAFRVASVLAVFERAGDRGFFFGAGLPARTAVDVANSSRSAASQCCWAWP